MTATLNVRPVFRGPDLTVFAVESAEGFEDRAESGGFAYRSIRPVAVITQTAMGLSAVDMDGSPVVDDEIIRLLTRSDLSA